MCPSRRRSPLDSSDGTSPHVAGDLLRAYPPMSQAKWAHVESSVNLDASGNPDPYFMSIDLATARHPQTLLATHFNGEPLTVEHGAPLRLLMPVKLGLKNVKAITKITYVAEETRDYWAERGYSRFDGIQSIPTCEMASSFAASERRLVKLRRFESALLRRAGSFLIVPVMHGNRTCLGTDPPHLDLLAQVGTQRERAVIIQPLVTSPAHRITRSLYLNLGAYFQSFP